MVGAALFDLKNPRKIIAKTKKPLIIPRKKYETGTFEDKKVIFPTGAVTDKNKKHLLLFNGAGDRVTTVKKLLLEEVMKELEKS